MELPEETRTVTDEYEEDYPDSMSDKSDESEYDEEEHWELNDKDIEDIIEHFNSGTNESFQGNTSNSGTVNTGILHFTVLFLWLWGSFYGISATAISHLIQFYIIFFQLLLLLVQQHQL